MAQGNWGKGRGGRQWRKLRALILERDAHLCQPCRRRGILALADAVDHIRAIVNGGTDADDNLEAICNRCHASKTRHDQVGKTPGCDAKGDPVDPGHHWHGEG